MSFRHSIQWRILAYYTGLVALAVAVLIAFFYLYERRAQAHLTELKLQRQAVLVIPLHFAPGPPRDHRRRSESPERMRHRERVFGELRKEKVFWRAVETDGTPMGQSEDFPVELEGHIQRSGSESAWDFVETEAHFLVFHAIPRRGHIVVGTPKDVAVAGLNRILLHSIGIGLLVTITTGAFGYWIVRSALKPIGLISDTAQRIASGDISERIETRAVRSELGQLANVLNTTFARLGDALKRQIQFTSDASHELRTPVAAIIADCQFSLRRERPAERYRETIEVCHESAQHMRSLIEDLRELADFDEKSETFVSEPVEIRDFMDGVINVMAPLAGKKNLVLKGDLNEGIAHLDPMRMRQAIINILNNAICYTPSDGRIDVSTTTGGSGISIIIRDTGIGIDPDKLPHIFDRFYRADGARNAHTGGVGLGLSITRSIVEASGGRITVESEPGVGTCFRVELPLA